MNKGKKILVVDDMTVIRNMLNLNLKKAGFKVILARNGKEALGHLSSVNKPALIILDVMMPGMNGYEVLKELKASDDTKDIPVVLLTGNDREEDVVKGIELGASDYVVKPYKPAELIGKIERLIC